MWHEFTLCMNTKRSARKYKIWKCNFHCNPHIGSQRVTLLPHSSWIPELSVWHFHMFALCSYGLLIAINMHTASSVIRIVSGFVLLYRSFINSSSVTFFLNWTQDKKKTTQDSIKMFHHNKAFDIGEVDSNYVAK